MLVREVPSRSVITAKTPYLSRSRKYASRDAETNARRLRAFVPWPEV
jgi:hypothetical protein